MERIREEIISRVYQIRGCEPCEIELQEYLLENGAVVSCEPSTGLYRAHNGLVCKAVYISEALAGFSFRRHISQVDREIFSCTDIGRAYLEYNRQIGGDPFGFTTGMPLIDLDLYGGIAGMYQECIKQGKTWEELLQWDGHSDELRIMEG